MFEQDEEKEVIVSAANRLRYPYEYPCLCIAFWGLVLIRSLHEKGKIPSIIGAVYWRKGRKIYDDENKKIKIPTSHWGKFV